MRGHEEKRVIRRDEEESEREQKTRLNVSRETGIKVKSNEWK